MTIHVFPLPDALTLWERYVALVKQQSENPNLLTDMKHQAELVRAHKRFAVAFTREDDGA